MFHDKPVRLKRLLSIAETELLENSNAGATEPGTAIYDKSLDCICIRCKVSITSMGERFSRLSFSQNGWVGFKKVAYRKSMYARDFHNGYLSKTDQFMFDSVHNPLFDHIHQQRLPS